MSTLEAAYVRNTTPAGTDYGVVTREAGGGSPGNLITGFTQGRFGNPGLGVDAQCMPANALTREIEIFVSPTALGNLYVRFSPAAEAVNIGAGTEAYVVRIEPGGYYKKTGNMPFSMHGLWDTADANAYAMVVQTLGT